VLDNDDNDGGDNDDVEQVAIIKTFFDILKASSVSLPSSYFP
jgi:hypothetical protein